jgi:hypothetical protein
MTLRPMAIDALAAAIHMRAVDAVASPCSLHRLHAMHCSLRLVGAVASTQ